MCSNALKWVCTSVSEYQKYVKTTSSVRDLYFQIQVDFKRTVINLAKSTLDIK